MDRIGSGLFAAFVATMLMAVILSIKQAIGVFPEIDIIQLLTTLAATRLGLPEHMAIGWGVHFFVGVLLWGPLFAIIEPRLPGNDFAKRGLVFGIGAWLVMMIVIMPLSGAGFFGLGVGIGLPIVALLMHIIFGLLFGSIYGSILRGRAATTR